MGKKGKIPFNIRLSPELEARLNDVAKKCKLPVRAVAQMAIEAAVEAIEQNSYKLVVPIQYRADIRLIATDVAVPNPENLAQLPGEFQKAAETTVQYSKKPKSSS